ncbi:hypothetical protein QAD02_020449 [Eretmocerus hayati]|uniref:Uncharacterized protein n=1 Tax=Eretmocerus hayati TaxID=131215 RepID=A0ACC2PPC4_9HYME|nr:hypothetical protein QAD02_020449 [Eretmocerus hayati]
MDPDCLQLDDERLLREREEELQESQEIEDSAESLSQLRICESPEHISSNELDTQPEISTSLAPSSPSPHLMSDDGYITRSFTMSPDSEEQAPTRVHERVRSKNSSSDSSGIIREARKRARSKSSSSDSSGSWHGVRHLRCHRRLYFTKEEPVTQKRVE